MEADWVSDVWVMILDDILTFRSLQIGDALAGMGYAGFGTLVILCIMEAVAFMCTRKPMEDGHHVLDVDDIVPKELLD